MSPPAFHGRPRDQAAAERLPPASTVTETFRSCRPALRLGRRLQIGRSRSPAKSTSSKHWTWDEFRKLPTETITRDIHCVTKWSKLDTVWEGVSVDTLLDGLETSAEYVMAFSDGGYTTNLPLEDVTGGKAWVAVQLSMVRRSRPEHGGPARLLVPHLYFWKSAKWVRGLQLMATRRARLLGDVRLPHVRRPVARAAVQRRLTWRLARMTRRIDETARARTLVLDVA